MAQEFNEWLAALPRRDGHACISEARRFQHDETAYDEQYGNEPDNLACGRGAAEFASECGIDANGPALEIGCGTGLMSLGLVDSRAFPAVLLTDPSPTFLGITEDKLSRAAVSMDTVHFGLLLGEDMHRLPPDMFALIAMRSALHHVLHVDQFLAAAARALRPGGALIFQEPCREGYVLMGAMAQFLPFLCAYAAKPLTDEQRAKADGFSKAMQFYARRDVDKSEAEDKHVFRVDDLMNWARSAGLSLQFRPNATFEHFAHPPESRSRPDRFRQFFYDYLKYCMSFDEPLMELFDRHLGPYCEWLDTLCDMGSAPYMHGVFLARRV